MDKIIDLNRSIKDICTEFPEVIEIMKEIGFENIANPVILNTAGRFMTIKKGAEMKKIDLKEIKDEFSKRGYKISE